MVKEVVSGLTTREKHTQSEKQEHVSGKERCVSRIVCLDSGDPGKKHCAFLNDGNVVNLSSYKLSPLHYLYCKEAYPLSPPHSLTNPIVM